MFCTFWLGNVLCATAACCFSTSESEKALHPWGVLYILTWKWAFVPIFRYLNFKKCSSPGVFCAFDLHTHTQTQSQKNSHVLNLFLCSRYQARGCFLSAWFAVHSPIFPSRIAWLGNVLRATRSCAIFRHPNFKKRSVAEVFLAFWLGNASRAIFGHPNFKKWSKNEVVWTFSLETVLRATVSCHFWASNFKKWWRNVVLDILTWKCASRHSSVQFFISLLNSYLGTPTFRPSGTTNHWKNTAIRDFPNISRVRVFFLFLVALLSSDSSSLLCFSCFHIVGS